MEPPKDVKRNLLNEFNRVWGKPPPPFGDWWSAAFFVGAGTVSLYAFSQSPRQFSASFLKGGRWGLAGLVIALSRMVFLHKEANPALLQAQQIWTKPPEPWSIRSTYLAVFVAGIYAIGEFPPEGAKLTGWGTGLLISDLFIESSANYIKKRWLTKKQ